MRKFTPNNPIEEEKEIPELEQKELSIEDIEYNAKKAKKEEKKRRKDKAEAFFKKELRKRKREKLNKPYVSGIVATIILMLLVMSVYSFAYLFSPDLQLVATVSVVRGGYGLEYPILTTHINALNEDVKVNDVFYIDQNGKVSKLSRGTLKVRVIDIDEEGNVKLEFDATNIPTFISTKDMKYLIQSSSSGKQVSQVVVSGRIVANRFSTTKIIAK